MSKQIQNIKYRHKDCRNCSKLNGRVDDKGYPFAYECLKYELTDILTPEKFQDSKGYR